jgi:hypothetical protein
LNFVIYDIETLAECFLIVLHDVNSNKCVCYKISKYKNDKDIMIKHIKSLIQRNYYFVGFNNINFDAQVVQYILTHTNCTVNDIYNESQRIINMSDDEKFTSSIPEWKLMFKQIDLYLINHYDNANKRTSLKWLEFSMRMLNIEEMPIEHWKKNLIENDENLIEQYCNVDVDATLEFFKRNIQRINLRQELKNIYNLNFLNDNDPKIGSKIILDLVSKELNLEPSVLKKQRTIRNVINIKDVIFDYIKFEDVKFNNLLTAFNKLKLHDTKKPFEYSILHKNLEYVYGVGGIHGAKQGVYESTDLVTIKSCDVTSLYPSIAIQNNLFPLHLSNSFCNVYNNIFIMRNAAKKAGNKAVNEGLKLALNGAYGKSNESTSFLFDTQFTMSITINGQLLLSMLSEKLAEHFEIIMINTDGLECIVPNNKQDLYFDICKEWEKTSKLNLEYADYKKIVIRDVNNYIAQDFNNKIKRKGAFEIYDDIVSTGNYHKNPSMLIVPLALQNYFINGIEYKSFIKNHNNIFDFCLGVKKKSDFEIVDYTLQNNNLVRNTYAKIVRYYISNKGSYLLKEYSKKRITKIEAGWKTTVLNNIIDTNALNYDINYQYYIEEVEKIIYAIEGNKNQTIIK